MHNMSDDAKCYKQNKNLNRGRESAGNFIFKRVFRKDLSEEGIYEQRLGRIEGLSGDI